MKMIPAYTIIEVTLAMAISALSMTFMFKGKLFFEKLFITHQKVEMETLEVNLLDKSLRKDFFYSEDVRWDENQLLFLYPQDSLVGYAFMNERTIKFSGTRTDTFNVVGMQDNRLIPKHITEFRVKMKLKNRLMVYTYQREYSPYQKMKHKE